MEIGNWKGYSAVKRSEIKIIPNRANDDGHMPTRQREGGGIEIDKMSPSHSYCDVGRMECHDGEWKF